jgi:hypothetical protein
MFSILLLADNTEKGKAAIGYQMWKLQRGTIKKPIQGA